MESDGSSNVEVQQYYKSKITVLEEVFQKNKKVDSSQMHLVFGHIFRIATATIF